MVSELVRNRILNRLPPFSDAFFDDVYDVLLIGLKIVVELPPEKVYEFSFWDTDTSVITLYDPETQQVGGDYDIAACTVWNEYENRPVCGLQTMLDCLETWMPKNEDA